MKNVLLLIFILCIQRTGLAQLLPDNTADIDLKLLNRYIVEEVNALRKKAKADPLANDSLLLPAADDHARYMSTKNKLTHFQKSKIKKTPKNRVDFYGAQFPVVGENVQQTHLSLSGPKKNNKETGEPVTYESLAKALVLNWKNSPPHYKNMIEPGFKTTYVSLSMSADGKLYACQLFGSVHYEYPEGSPGNTYPYKPEKDCKCKRLNKKLPYVDRLVMLPDSNIVLYSDEGRKFKKTLRNPWNDAFAVDIVLKSQYPCGSENTFNGMHGVRGTPLQPVFKKDFRKGPSYANHLPDGHTMIILGKMPSWVKEDYELNLIVINHKRTCESIVFNEIPVGFYLNFNIPFKLDTLTAEMVKVHYDTVQTRIYYNRNAATVADSVLQPIVQMIERNQSKIMDIEVKGFSSVEGTTELNEELYEKRAQVLVNLLRKYSVDSADIRVSASENFAGLRKDLPNTMYKNMLEMDDAHLKEAINNSGAMRHDLEPFFSKHRYAELKMILRTEEKIEYNKKNTQELLQKYIDTDRKQEAKRMQSVEFGLAMRGDVTLADFDNVNVKKNRDFLNLLNNRVVMKYYMDSLNPERESELRTALEEMYEIDSSNKIIATNLEILDYKTHLDDTRRKMLKYFQKLNRKKNVDKRIKARMLLNLCVYYDWTHLNAPAHLYQESKRYIKDAKLTPEETFDLAGYYAYWDEEIYAYNLTKNILSKTYRLNDLLFFLKLIHLTNLQLPRNTYLGLFKKIQRLSGDKFCTLFNSPALNFQILDDPDIKKIYCKQCASFHE